MNQTSSSSHSTTEISNPLNPSEESKSGSTFNPEEFFARLQERTKHYKARRHILIKGIEDENFEYDERAVVPKRKGWGSKRKESKPYAELTEEQVSTLRYILVTTNRGKEIKTGEKYVTCGEKWLNTDTGNTVVYGLEREIDRAMAKSLPLNKQFDALFGLTYMLGFHNFWMNDNELYGPESELERGISKLARSWRELLSHSDRELGIDPEFTRPGIEAMLEKFADQCKVSEGIEGEFVWRE